MKVIDWQMLYFVGITLIKEYWYFWGLPRVYYWELKQQYTDEDDNKAA
ncbi:MAG TPA: hypothetical protein VEY68_06630 [Anoxybacillus sp.]|nr:hypothetical protein [Anoxybacillus sp.]